MIAIIVGILMALALVAALSIDFVYASRQEKKSDKSTLIAAGAMTAIAGGIMLIMIVYMDSGSGSANSRTSIPINSQLAAAMM